MNRRFLHVSTRLLARARGGKRDPLTSTPLMPVAPEKSLNVYTEQVRLNKAIYTRLQDKIAYEFPQLKQYAVEYKPRGVERLLHFEARNQIFPGADLHPDPNVVDPCTVHFRIDDVMAQIQSDDVEVTRRKLILLAGEYFCPNTRAVTLTVHRFPSYGENKQWALDTIAALIQEATNVTENTFDELQLPQETQQKVVQKRVEQSLDFPDEWKRSSVASNQ